MDEWFDMDNRTVVILTVAVIFGMCILLALNLTNILTGQPENQTFLKYNDIRGMAVEYHQQLFTLNFTQQNQVAAILNQAVRTMGIKPGKRKKPAIDKIIIYQFNNQPDIIVTPIAYIGSNLAFSAPQWNANGYLIEVSEGELRDLLSQTYDP